MLIRMLLITAELIQKKNMYLPTYLLLYTKPIIIKVIAIIAFKDNSTLIAFIVIKAEILTI